MHPGDSVHVRDHLDLANRVPFLGALSDDDRRRLLPAARLRRLAPGSAVWNHGATADEFLFVLQGRVKLVNTSADGREAIVDLRAAGQLLCSGAVCVMAPYCCSAVAHSGPIDIVAFPRQALFALVETSPAAARAFVREVAQCAMTLCHRVEELTSGVVERRLAMLLLRLADHLGESREDGLVWIPVALSRQDLADLCNTSVETASRTMSRLARDGVVDTRTGGFAVLDRAALAALVV
jgi:CRP-like cAMP-binding protein